MSGRKKTDRYGENLCDGHFFWGEQRLPGEEACHGVAGMWEVLSLATAV